MWLNYYSFWKACLCHTKDCVLLVIWQLGMWEKEIRVDGILVVEPRKLWQRDEESSLVLSSTMMWEKWVVSHCLLYPGKMPCDRKIKEILRNQLVFQLARLVERLDWFVHRLCPLVHSRRQWLQLALIGTDNLQVARLMGHTHHVSSTLSLSLRYSLSLYYG